MRRALVAPFAGVLLSGCASTLSFSPPAVPIAYQGDRQGSQTCDQKNNATVTVVNRDVAGAWTVIDTFAAAYACSRDAVANGRQAFDLPAFVSTTGAATAIALGATPVATIGLIGTAASSTANAGKAYYDPQAKADMYASAVSALRCIRRVSVGEPAAQVEKANAAKTLVTAQFWSSGQTPPQVSFSAD